MVHHTVVALGAFCVIIDQDPVCLKGNVSVLKVRVWEPGHLTYRDFDCSVMSHGIENDAVVYDFHHCYAMTFAGAPQALMSVFVGCNAYAFCEEADLSDRVCSHRSFEGCGTRIAHPEAIAQRFCRVAHSLCCFTSGILRLDFAKRFP
jgi:hypothetical protein